MSLSPAGLALVRLRHHRLLALAQAIGLAAAIGLAVTVPTVQALAAEAGLTRPWWRWNHIDLAGGRAARDAGPRGPAPGAPGPALGGRVAAVGPGRGPGQPPPAAARR